MSEPIRIQPGMAHKAMAAVLATAALALAAQTAALQSLSKESLRKGLQGVVQQSRHTTGGETFDRRVLALAEALQESSVSRRWMFRIALAALFAGAAAGLFAGRPTPTRSVAALGALLGGATAYCDLQGMPVSFGGGAGMTVLGGLAGVLQMPINLDFASAVGGGFHFLTLATLGLVPVAALLCTALSFQWTWTAGARATR